MRRAVLLSLLFACAEARELPDAGTPVDSGVKEIVFEGESVDGPALVFGQGTVTADRLEIDLTAQALARVYGLAYRIEFDPAVLAFDRLDRSVAFIHDDLFEVKEARPGLLIVAMSAVGPIRGIDLEDDVIARISFARKSGASTDLKITRPFALDEEGLELRLGGGAGRVVER
jgi:hypothetical protein